MLIGTITNEILFLMGIPQPLSVFPFLLAVNIFIILGALFDSIREHSSKFMIFSNCKNFLSLFAIILPILSVVGTFWVNVMNSNIILLFTILMIAIFFIISIISEKFISKSFYFLVIFSTSLALLFHSSLISNYIYGARDGHLEYFVAKLTKENNYWNSSSYSYEIQYGRFNSMLSITVFPTIYSNALNVEIELIYKVIFPVIFAFTLLGLYKIWVENIGWKKTALIAAFLLMSQETFYSEMVWLARQMMAELFFALLILVIMDKNLKSSSAKIILIFFSFGLIVSHYAMALIFLFIVTAAWLYTSLSKKKPRNLDLIFIIIFAIIMFSWYIYVSNSTTFRSILRFGDHVLNNLNEFFDPTSRGEYVMRGLGMEPIRSPLKLVSRTFAYAVQFFITIGFVVAMTNPKKLAVNPEYVVFLLMAMVILGACIVLPSFAETLNMTRFYHITLFFIAPCFAFGCNAFIDFLTKKNKEIISSILVIIILVPYLLFQTNFIYEITKTEAWSIPLSKERMDRTLLYGTRGYLDDELVTSAQWLSKNVNVHHSQIYADMISRSRVLTSYGMIYSGHIDLLTNSTNILPNGIVYLNRLNVVEGLIVGRNNYWNYSDFSDIFNNLSKIYSNGECEIYLNSN